MLKQESYSNKFGDSKRQPQYFLGQIKRPAKLEPSNLLDNKPHSVMISPLASSVNSKLLPFTGKGAPRSVNFSPPKIRIDPISLSKPVETEPTPLSESKSPKTEETSLFNSHRRYYSSKVINSPRKNRLVDSFKDQDSQPLNRESISESSDFKSDRSIKTDSSVPLDSPTQKNSKSTTATGSFSNYELYLNRLSQLANSYSKLPKVEPSKYSDKTFGPVKAYCACTNQGLVRNYNEDRVSIVLNVSKPDSKSNKKNMQPNCHFLGVYDGHGGNLCAEYCRSNLHQFVLKSRYFPLNPQEALREGFERTDNEFREMVLEDHDRTGGVLERSGSCAIGVLFVDDAIHIANLGDSRAVASLNGGLLVVPLTRDHKPSDKQEQKRIEMAGGRIYQNFPLSPTGKRLDLDPAANPFQVVVPHRVFPGRLSVSRTIGDTEAKTERVGGNPNVLISKPEITTFTISKEHDFILIGSDGIFEKATNEDLISEVWRQFHKDENADLDIHGFAKIATESVLKESMLKKSLDNVTAVLIFLPAFEERFNREVLKLKDLGSYNLQNKLKTDSSSLLLASPRANLNTDRPSPENIGFSQKMTAKFDARGPEKKLSITALRSSASTLPSLSIKKPVEQTEVQSPRTKQITPRKVYQLQI